MVEGSTFHCAVSARSLKEEEEGAEHGRRGSKHPQGRRSGAEKPQQSVEKEIVLTLLQNSWKVLLVAGSAEVTVRQQNLYVRIGYGEDLHNFTEEKNEFL